LLPVLVVRLTISVSSDAVMHDRPSTGSFNYATQQFTNGQMNPTWTNQNQVAPGYSSGMPSQSFMGRRAMPNNLSIQVPTDYYQQQRMLHPGQMSLTPLSAPYMGAFGYTSVKPSALPMKRVGSQPVSGTKASRRSFSGESSSETTQENVPPRKITKEEASVMQPVQPPPHVLRRDSMPMVWTSQMQQMGQPMYHHAPMVSVHPSQQPRQAQQPLGYYSFPPTSQAQATPVAQAQAQPLAQALPLAPAPQLASAPRIHPPPHPGSSSSNGSRPMARLPSAASKRPRQPSSTTGTPTTRTPKPRSSPGRKRNVPSGGTFSWGDTTFINFTPDDGEKLLTGVAPSGSQSKRKREEEAQSQLLALSACLHPVEASDDSDLSDDNRSKRSRSD
jgi:hypothetical protein